MGATPLLCLTVSLLATFASVFTGLRAVLGRELRLRATTPRAFGAAQRTGFARRLKGVPFVGERLDALAHARRDVALRSCVPEALRLMSVAMETGSSVVQALAYAARNCAEPLASELKQAVWDLESGRTFDEAMEGLRERAGGTEFAYLAVAMEIQHRCGGSLAAVIDTVAETLRQMARLEEELKTKTAQGRLSARIVAIMPMALLVVLSLVSPGYLTGFFSSALGVVMFVFALALELLGVLMVRRALAIDLSCGMGGGTR